MFKMLKKGVWKVELALEIHNCFCACVGVCLPVRVRAKERAGMPQRADKPPPVFDWCLSRSRHSEAAPHYSHGVSEGLHCGPQR